MRTSDSKNPWSRFSYKALTAYSKYKDRLSKMERELSRVGMQTVALFIDFPSPFREILLKRVRMTSFCQKKNLFFIGLNNYRAIATAYHLGSPNVLVMQDDIRFLKDVNLLYRIIETLPPDYDLAMMNHMKPSDMSEEEYKGIFNKKKINDYWVEFDCLTSSGCYAMSRRGMERYISAYERPLNDGKSILMHDDWYYRREILGADARLYVATPAPSVQSVCSAEGSHSDLSVYMRRNESIGLSRIKYAE